mmetsp:Transcript_2982/g.8403  ORF Transcript_2982/g.8403 Transcript_2982/m.8403 type:complete len:272 (-) Transcript_2982:767-1582(-)
MQRAVVRSDAAFLPYSAKSASSRRMSFCRRAQRPAGSREPKGSRGRRRGSSSGTGQGEDTMLSTTGKTSLLPSSPYQLTTAGRMRAVVSRQGAIPLASWEWLTMELSRLLMHGMSSPSTTSTDIPGTASSQGSCCRRRLIVWQWSSAAGELSPSAGSSAPCSHPPGSALSAARHISSYEATSCWRRGRSWGTVGWSRPLLHRRDCGCRWSTSDSFLLFSVGSWVPSPSSTSFCCRYEAPAYTARFFRIRNTVGHLLAASDAPVRADSTIAR